MTRNGPEPRPEHCIEQEEAQEGEEEGRAALKAFHQNGRAGQGPFRNDEIQSPDEADTKEKSEMAK
jgi:hypothetical protein